MDFEKIRDLIETLTGLMEARRLDELEVEWEGLKVALRRARNGGTPQVVAAAPPPVAVAPSVHAPEPKPAPELPPQRTEEVHVVKSPMVGILYRSPSPDAEPFVEVGDEVKADSVVCIIEAMKVMNEVKAEADGVVQSIEVENGHTVEYGQPLFVIARKES
ncbi:MAG: acetyl-CoA carboxylase biotin carboxyl carrier protein [Planctomycetes bacterium]|nr:acetyl-CoA carboxylase biotin carboxyl carrier protein [Planctomycetota bacterium]